MGNDTNPQEANTAIDKVAMMKHMIDIYSHTLITPNLEMHALFYSTIQKIQSHRKDVDIKDKCKYIQHVIINNTKNIQSIPKPCEFARYALPVERLDEIISCCNHEYKLLESLRGALHSDRIFSMIRFIYHSILHQQDFNYVVAILNWLFTQPAKCIFSRPDKSLDVLHIMYGLLVHMAAKISSDAEKYAMISKELTFFKVSKTYALTNRVDMFFTTLYVVFHNRVDMTKLSKRMDDMKRNYMFVLCRVDKDYMNEVRLDRLRTHDDVTHKSNKKRLNIDDYSCPQRKDTANIVKISC